MFFIHLRSFIYSFIKNPSWKNLSFFSNKNQTFERQTLFVSKPRLWNKQKNNCNHWSFESLSISTISMLTWVETRLFRTQMNGQTTSNICLFFLFARWWSWVKMKIIVIIIEFNSNQTSSIFIVVQIKYICVLDIDKDPRLIIILTRSLPEISKNT